MQQQNIPIGTLVDMYKRGELRLPEIQRHYVWALRECETCLIRCIEVTPVVPS